MANNRPRTTSQILQARIQRFSRVEKAFYGAIVLTAVILATSVVFMQTKLLQVQRDLTTVNSKIEAKRTELDDAKQADEIFQMLMGTKVGPRREFIEANAKFVENLDL